MQKENSDKEIAVVKSRSVCVDLKECVLLADSEE